MTARRLCAQLIDIDGSHLLRCMAEALESSPYCAAHAQQRIRDTRMSELEPDPPAFDDGLPWNDDHEGES